MDARQATKTVKDYFSEMHGSHGSVAFRVEAVEYADPLWEVTCSMFASLEAQQRSHYLVAVRSDGSIDRVELLARTTPDA
jgi:hypothetical protein